MLQLVLGRAGTRKSEWIRRELVRRVNQGEEHMILLVPEQFSFTSEKALLEALGESRANRVQVLSFTRLADAVFRIYGKRRAGTVLDDSGKAMLMSLALDGVQDHLQMFRKSVGNMDFVEKLLTVFGEFQTGQVPLSALEEAARKSGDSLLQQKAQEIALILESYTALTEGAFADPMEQLTYLAELLRTIPFFQGKTVALDGFSSFTGQETAILRRLFHQAKQVFITLCTERFSDQEDFSLFAPVNRTARQVIRLAKQEGASVAPPRILTSSYRFEGRPALAALEKNLFQSQAEPFDGSAQEVILYQAKEKYGECDFVARTVKELLRSGAVRCREIAVITGSMEEYAAPLAAALKEYGVPVFEDRRQPVSSQPLMALVRWGLRVLTGGWQTEDLMGMLKTGLAGLSVEETARLENYVLLWKINGRAWLAPFQKHPEGFETEFTQEQAQALDEVNLSRRKAVEPLRRLLAQGVGDGKDLAAALYDWLMALDVPGQMKTLAVRLDRQGESALAREQGRIWDLFMELLSQCGAVLQGHSLSLSRFAALLELAVDRLDLGSIPEGLDSLLIGEAGRVRPDHPKIVFLLGANVGQFPRIPAQKGLFSEGDRKELRMLGLELDEPLEWQTMEERFITYCAATSARDRLYITFRQAELDGEESLPSPLVEEVRRILPQCSQCSWSEETGMDQVGGMLPTLDLTARLWRENTSFSASLKAYFEAKPEFHSRLEGLRRAAEGEPFHFRSAEQAKELFGEHLLLSASRVEEYFHCPFLYFCKFGLGAKPRKTAEMDPMQTGTVIHYVLETLVKEDGKEGLCAFSPVRRRERIEQLLRSYLKEQMGVGEDASPRFVYLFERLSQTLDAVAAHLAEELRQSQFEPVDCELNIDRGGDIKPLTIDLPDGGCVQIRGKVDRVDWMKTKEGNFLRVVDYKSGSKVFSLGEVLQGLNMQMLLYLLCLCENGEARYGPAAPAGVLYMPARSSMPPLSRGTDAPTLERAKEKGLRMNGLVVNEPDVLTGMEERLEGRFIPVSQNKSGALSGSLISLNQLGVLFHQMEETLRQMGECLHQGKILPAPVQGGNYKHTCDYCDYQSVCCQQGDPVPRELKEWDDKKALEQLRGKEETPDE